MVVIEQSYRIFLVILREERWTRCCRQNVTAGVNRNVGESNCYLLPGAQGDDFLLHVLAVFSEVLQAPRCSSNRGAQLQW